LRASRRDRDPDPRRAGRLCAGKGTGDGRSDRTPARGVLAALSDAAGHAQRDRGGGVRVGRRDALADALIMRAVDRGRAGGAARRAPSATAGGFAAAARAPAC
jgi:hypothetical protein